MSQSIMSSHNSNTNHITSETPQSKCDICITPSSVITTDYNMVFDGIQRTIGYDMENVTIKMLKNGASVYMFGVLSFSIKINSRTQTISTKCSAALEYVDRIKGASSKGAVIVFPITTDFDSYTPMKEMINAVYNNRQQSITGDMIGCCDMFIMCSDALRCLRSDDPHYNGCLYRKNLESGRIFYGKNKNI